MQNSPERLLEGIAQSLREVVEPQVGDPYALAQLRAAAEILDNLAGRVEWGVAALGDSIAAVDGLLRAAIDRAPEGELSTARALLAAEPPPSEPSRAWAGSLEALAEVQEWLARPTVTEPALDAALRALLRAESEREQRLLRTGSFRPERAGG